MVIWVAERSVFRAAIEINETKGCVTAFMTTHEAFIII